MIPVFIQRLRSCNDVLMSSNNRAINAIGTVLGHQPEPVNPETPRDASCQAEEISNLLSVLEAELGRASNMADRLEQLVGNDRGAKAPGSVTLGR